MSSSDMISGLPEDLVSQILSLLPTANAVRTSVLSKRWKFLWTLISNIQLSANYSTHDVSHINRFLLLLNQQSINKFSLNLFKVYEVPQLDSWISDVVRRNVKDLELLLYKTRDLPVSFFQCKTLEVVRLCSVGFTIPKSGFISFPNLKILDLEDVEFGEVPDECCGCFPGLEKLRLENVTYMENDDGLNKLLRNSPVLKDLFIESYIMSCTNINIPTLQSVVIVCSYFEGEIIIDAPFLQNLKLDVNDGTERVIIKAPDSVISLRFSLEFSYWPIERQYDIFKVVKAVDKVKYLYLSLSRGFVYDMKSRLDKLPMFLNLIHLELAFTFKESSVLECFLTNSTNLQHLVIKKIPHCADKGAWSKFSHVPVCMLTSLKTVHIKNIDGHGEYEVAMIQDLLKCGKVMHKLIIWTKANLHFVKEALPDKILMLLQGSALSEFEYK